MQANNKSLRTIKVVLPVVALVATVLFFSFRTPNIIEEENYYFEFIPQPTSLPGDADYENATNWINLPTFNPEESESPCNEGLEFVCVLAVPKEDVDNSTGGTLEAQLADLISNQPSPTMYVNGAENAITKKNRAVQ